jgi:site-specific DNA-adenine methylase
MAIPYLGSKRQHAGKIYQTIKNLNPDATILVDLFCGGFAMSEFFIKEGWSVIANDKNKYVVALIKEATSGRFNDDTFIVEFITREKFNDVLTNRDNYEDWFVGYVMCIWSFGNNQKGYLFGKDVEPYKKAGHELVINKDSSLIKKLIPDIPQVYIDGIIKQGNWHKRRIALAMVTRKLKTRIFELQQLQQLEQLEQLERLQQLEQLEQLERLEQLQQLQQLQQLELYSKSYNEIEIPKGAVVYCDPPYQGTAEYSEGGFNHKEFWDWVRNKSKTNKVYISEYNAPNDFKFVLSFKRNSTYAGGNNKKQPDEKLFTLK